MLGDPFRIEPRLPVHAVKTYQATSATRPATCEEVDCPQYLGGWQTIVPDPSGHADLVRSLRGRYRFTEEAQPGGLVAFTFPPGQRCFQQSLHRLPAEGGERWLVRGGDWRGNPRQELREHTRAEFWVEDFAEHQQTLAERLERG